MPPGTEISTHVFFLPWRVRFIHLKKGLPPHKTLVSVLPFRCQTSLKPFSQAQQRTSPSLFGRELGCRPYAQTQQSPPLYHRTCGTRVLPLLIARTCRRRLCRTSTVLPVLENRSCSTTHASGNGWHSSGILNLDLLVNTRLQECLLCIKVAQALRPWPLPPSSNVSIFMLSLRWVSNTPPIVNFTWPQPRACHSVGPPSFLLPNFPPFFDLRYVHRLLLVYCSGGMPLAIGLGSSTFL